MHWHKWGKWEDGVHPFSKTTLIQSRHCEICNKKQTRRVKI